MTKTSETGYYEQYASAVFAESEPLSVGDCRRLANNACHLADEFAQVRVNSALHTGSLSTFAKTIADVSTAFQRIIGWTFPMNVRPTGETYELRARIVPGLNSGTAETCVFKVALTPFGMENDTVFASTVGDNAFTFTGAPSSSPSWNDAFSGLVWMDRSLTAMAIRQATSKSADGATDQAANWCLVTLSIWARNISVGQLRLARVHGAYAAEYIGL